MMRLAALGTAGLMLLSAGPAFAQATVTPLGGTVLVNRGSGYVNLSGRTVRTGDRVMVRPGGRAELTYANGCVKRVAPGAVVVVGTPASCLAALRVASAAPATAPTATGVGGGTAGAAGAAAGATAGGLAGLGVGGTLLVAGAVAGALVAGVLVVAASTEERPVSP